MSDTLHSAERALGALLLFDGERREIGVTELARCLDCSTSTAMRTIETLTAMDFLRRDPHRRTYRLSGRALGLARTWHGMASLANVTRPIVAKLAEGTGLTATFAVADHAHMRAVVAVDGADGPLRNYPMTGELFPAHVGAISKAYYAFLPKIMRDQLTGSRPMAQYTERTRTGVSDIEEQFSEIRQAGYCTTKGEYDADVSALAMPIRATKDPLGSVSVATKGNLEITQQLLDQVAAATKDIGLLLGRRQ